MAWRAMDAGQGAGHVERDLATETIFHGPRAGVAETKTRGRLMIAIDLKVRNP